MPSHSASRPAPVAVEPLDDYLDRRELSRIPMSSGETVTLVVGLIRGCRLSPSRATAMRWWLTDHGGVVAIDDPEGDDLISATADALGRAGGLTSQDSPRLVDAIRDAIITKPPRAWDDAERRAFALAEPEPLILGPLIPAASSAPSPRPEPVEPGLLLRLARAIDADWARSLDDALAALRDRSARAKGTGRRGLIVCTGVVVIAVVAAGLFLAPPGDDVAASGSAATTTGGMGGGTPMPGSDTSEPAPGTESEAHANQAAEAAPPTSESVSSAETTGPGDGTSAPASAAEPAGAGDSDDPLPAVRALLAAYAACNGLSPCERNLREREPDLAETTPITDPRAEAELIEQFGGLAIVRISEGDQKQYVTIVRVNERWLVRAVRAVADQPS